MSLSNNSVPHSPAVDKCSPTLTAVGGRLPQARDSMTSAEEDDTEQCGPVNLVKRVKSEEIIVPDGSSSEDQTPSPSDHLTSILIRRRRRGRGRYTPFFVPSNFFPVNNHCSSLSKPPPLPSSSIRGPHETPSRSTTTTGGTTTTATGGGVQFICPNCPALFPNRDALAMHMMDSVRSQGCAETGGRAASPTSSSSSIRGLPPPLPLPLPPAPAAVVSTTTAVKSNRIAEPRPQPPTPNHIQAQPPNQLQQPYACRVCGEAMVNVDSLAMHMLGHAHQQQLRLEADRNGGGGGHIGLRLEDLARLPTPTSSDSPQHPIKFPNGPLCFAATAIDFTNVHQAMVAAAAAAAMTTAATAKTNHQQQQLPSRCPLVTAAVGTSGGDQMAPPPKCHSAPVVSRPDTTLRERKTFQQGIRMASSSASGSTPEPPSRLRIRQDDGVDGEEEEEDDMEDVNRAIGGPEGNDALIGGVEEDETGVDTLGGGQSKQRALCSSEEGTSENDNYLPYACQHCRITFADRTVYCLHMGLHNVNNPWQCNMCGSVCSGLHEFASHSLHF